MYSFELYRANKVMGNKYTFPKRGDGIAMHSHHEWYIHNVIVLSGSVEVYGPGKEWSVTLNTGDIYNLEEKHNPHEVAALENNTKILGLWTNIQPVMIEQADSFEKEGTVEDPITIPLTEK